GAVEHQHRYPLPAALFFEDDCPLQHLCHCYWRQIGVLSKILFLSTPPERRHPHLLLWNVFGVEDQRNVVLFRCLLSTLNLRKRKTFDRGDRDRLRSEEH